MSPQRILHEREKIAHRHTTAEGNVSSPLSSARSSSYSASASVSRSSPQTRLRHRQLVQPITPTELEPVPEQEQVTGGTTAPDNHGNIPMRYPRVVLSSIDLAKPRTYTRLLYFFEASQQQQQQKGSFGQQQKQHDASLSAKGATSSNNSNTNNINNNNNTSSSSSASSTTFATALSPPASPAGSSSSSSAKKPSSAKSRHHHHPYHYHASPFMDPMLLQASLALVLSDFFPLAGRLCSGSSGSKNNTQSLNPNHAGATSTRPSSSSSTTTHTPATSSTPATTASNNNNSSERPFIECNDQGVLFVVADTTTTMAQIRHGGYQDATLPPQLFPVGLYPASLRDPPLLGIQLTYTPDQSLIMGVAMDSSVLDATSWVSFMEAWSKMTQGKDFGPFPILDRTFLEIHGDPYLASAVYRHQRINDSPPPPILFDNSLDLDRGLGELELTTSEDEDDDDDDEDEDEEEDPSNLQRAQRLMGSISEDSGKGTSPETADSIPRVMSGDVEHLEGPVEDIAEHQHPQQQRRAGGRRLRRRQESNSSAIYAGSEQEPEGDNLHLFHFSPQQLDAIKKLASEQNIAAAACAADDKEISDKWVSTGDSLVAYLWKMSTITRRMEPDCKMMCGLVMDIRHRVAPPIPEGYIGNAILDELMLQSPEQIKSAISWIQRQENPHLIETTSNNPFGQDFMVWSFRKLDMYSPDFGQGPPTKVRIGRGGFGGGEGMCVIMDSGPGFGGGSGGGGGGLGVDVYMGLQGEHLRDFETVHRGFMEGLLGPSGSGSGSGVGSSSGDWEVI
ncbi:hypothetical protein BGZ95_006624 [Linnemannia exigua]|uniref:Transferase n=1 Tax=Linnemannia exigua TaxID=604196 RepID=A0AAD4HAU7_9FUNG|nr:hypothetical protein BGZ95_006624 [Linnemannia exigua]